MRLYKLIGDIGAKYDPQSPASSQAHRLLRQAEAVLKQWIPPGYVVEGTGEDDCGGVRKPAVTPGIAILDPDETTTTHCGMFVAYLFAADKSTVTLTLTQSAGEMVEQLGRAGARLVLALEAATIRVALRPYAIADLDLTFDLRATAELSVDYQHANIVSRTYRLDRLADESEMVADLQRFVRLYALALQAREVARRLNPNTAKQEPEPEIRVDNKRKILTRSLGRRAVLAAFVAAPVAYLAPKVAAAPRQSAVAPVSIQAEPAPMFTIDVSQHDWRRRGGNLDWVGIRNAGIAGMCARATYGDPSGYNWATYHFADFVRAAGDAGIGLRGGYHNLVKGDQASINRQVDWLRRELDRHEANWAMLDIERYSELVNADMWPRWEDVRRFDDRWAEVDSRVLVGYLPPWNWGKYMGQPDLREFRGPLIASNYPLQANEDFKRLYEQIDGDEGRGWAAYGNRVPEGWQYSSRAKVPGAPNICDVNAWRLTYGQLKTLLLDPR